MTIGRRLLARRDAPGLGAVVPTYGGALNAAGVSVTAQTGLRNGAVWSGLQQIGNTMSLLDPVYKGGALPSLFTDPGPDTTWVDVMFQMGVAQAWYGNAYAAIVERDTRGNASGVLVLDPQTVRPFRPKADNPALGHRAGELRYRVGRFDLPADDMVHVRGFTLPGSDVGLSLIEYAATEIGLGIAAAQFGANWCRDGASPSSVLQTDQALDDDATEALSSMWTELHQGKRRTAVLTNGLQWKPIVISPEESQFLGTITSNVEAIARWLGMPQHKLGALDHATFSNIEHQQIEYLTDCIAPKAARFEHAWARAAGIRPDAFTLSPRRILRADSKTQAEVLEIERRNGIISADTWAVEVGRDRLPNGLGAAYLQPLNMAEVGTGEDAKSILARAQAALALVTAGYDPGGVLASLGLQSLPWLGPTPKTESALAQITPGAATAPPDGGAPQP